MFHKNNYRCVYRVLLIVAINFFSIFNSPLMAAEPFKTITLGLNLLTNSNRNTFHQYWEPIYGIEAIGEVPFYLGSLEGGLFLFSFNGKSIDYPEFFSLYLFAGWGIKINFGSDLSWYNGLRIGTYQMRFDDNQIHPTQAVESELGAGIGSRFDLPILERLQLHLGIDYLIVFTQKKLEFVVLKAGISYTVDSPGWLKDFLK